jgi:hypothetical protein
MRWSKVSMFYTSISNQMSKQIVIGYNAQRERELGQMADTIQKAFRGLENAFLTQGVAFSLDVESALAEAANEVKLGGSREVSQTKKLDLLGINPELLRSASYQLAKACSDLGVEPSSLNADGSVPSKQFSQIVKEQCEIVASGDKAIELANTLNEVIKSMEAFYAFMAKHQMNRPNPYGLSQTTHGMIEGNGDGKYQINPNAFSIYSRG